MESPLIVSALIPMLGAMATMLRETAHEVSDRIVEQFPQVQGICLFGSVARGDADATSDIDLLVLGQDPSLSPSQIRQRLRGVRSGDRVSIIYHTTDTFEELFRRRERFLVHIQLEGEILHDAGGMLQEIQSSPPISGSTRSEIEDQLYRLTLYEDLSRFNGNYLFPLAHIYSIGKAIVMATLAQNAIYEFRRDHALRAFAERFPAATADIETLIKLAPFYKCTSKGTAERFPFSPYGCDETASEAMSAVRRLACYADQA